jgi:poly(ADP-ribose) glycohydrolase ARH3
VWGAQVQAAAVGLALRQYEAGAIAESRGFIDRLLAENPRLAAPELEWLAGNPAASPAEIGQRFGTGIAAREAVPAALGVFLSAPDDPVAAVTRAVHLGGDTDTIGAMTGALAGARNGCAAFPPRWLDALEQGPDGLADLLTMADRLCDMEFVEREANGFARD